MAKETGKYKLKEVVVRLSEGHPLYSDVPLTSPSQAMNVMARELSKYDREVLCVVNLNSKLKPINFNVVSIGSINGSIAAIPNILKTAILSNAAGFILLHNHPSGDTSPSKEDVDMTKRCVEAGKLLDIPCLDHVIVGGNEEIYSLREHHDADFKGKKITMTAEEVLMVKENEEKHIGENAGKGSKDMAEERNMEQKEQQEFREEISLRFGKGLAEPFVSKDGKEFVRIMIPNQDREDRTPWASFVLPLPAVHDNTHGKGLWARIPADGVTTVTKPVLNGRSPEGKNIWQDVRMPVKNRDLKEMVEFYIDKSPREKDVQEQGSGFVKAEAKEGDALPFAEKKKSKGKAREAVL